MSFEETVQSDGERPKIDKDARHCQTVAPLSFSIGGPALSTLITSGVIPDVTKERRMS